MIMPPVPISLEQLENFNYKTNGIEFEKNAWIKLHREFTTLETFWKLFGVPMTNRILNSKNFNDHREDVHVDIKKIGITCFSILLNISRTRDYLEYVDSIVRFQYFYIHLGIALGLIESLIFRVINLLNYLDSNEVKNLKLNGLNNLKKYINDFVINDECKELKNRETRKLLLTPILNEFFNKEIVENYKKFSKSISTYRNIIVHQVFVNFINFNGKNIFPQRDVIKEYIVKLHAEYEIERMTESEKEKNFIIVEDLLNENFNDFSKNFNSIFEVLNEKFKNAFFIEKRPEILRLYNVVVD